MNKGAPGYPPFSSEETDSPLILTPASSQGTNNELVTACSTAGSSNQTHFTHPMFNTTTNYQHPRDAAGFAHAMTNNNMEANPHPQAHPMICREDQAAYFQNLAHTAYQNYLNMSNGELPFGSHIGQTTSNNSATNNATSFSDRLREPYAWKESKEAELGACSTACEGDRPQDEVAGIGQREMDFRENHQRARYIKGMGLPNDGATAEERLLRAINMNHYILIGHINSREREMKEYVHTNVNQIVDHSAHALWKKMHLMQQKVDNLSKDSVNESIPPQSSFISPSSTRVSPRVFEAEKKEDHPLAHLELAILKLWAHIDKLKAENRLRSEGETERKELEELIASELLYHNHLMERMQAKISSMTKEVTCCWTEIQKLQNAVKELESGGSVKKAPVVRTNSGFTNTGVAAAPWMSASEELRNATRKYSDKKINTPEEELECACDLCVKVRAGKSAGVTTEDKTDKPTATLQAVAASARLNKLKGTDKGRENVTSLDQMSTSNNGRLKRRCTVEKCLAALNLKPIASTIVTHFVSSSAVADKWRDIYSRSKQENQSIVEMKISNGDMIILLVEPSPDSGNIAMIIGQGVADSLVDLVTIDLIDFQVEVTEGVNSNVTFIGVTSTIPARSEDQRCSTTEGGKIRFPGTFDPTRERSNLSSPFLSQSGSRQAGKSQPCSSPFSPFAPLPKVARDTTSITRHLHKPKFGTYGFPWVESSEKLSSNSSPGNSTQVATPASSTYWLDEFPDKQQKEILVGQNETQQKDTKDQQSSYCDRLRESRSGKEKRREQISTGNIGAEKENGRGGSGSRSMEPKGEYETEYESIREKESDDPVLAAINAALTKMSNSKKMSEIGEKTVDVDEVVSGSSRRMDEQKHEKTEGKRRIKKRCPATALSMVAEAGFLSDSE